MHATAIERDVPSDAIILARVLGNAEGKLSVPMARHLLSCEFSASDKARMHELAVRNQGDALGPDERDELMAYSKAGTMLSLLKSRARRVLRGKGKRHPS
jgi:hypothetical protein